MAAKKKPTVNRAESIVCEKKFGIPLETQIAIRQKYESYKSILQLAKDIYNDQSLTEMSEDYKRVKNFVARVHAGVEVIDFDEDQIKFITDNGASMRAMDIARVLYKESQSNPLKECRSIVSLLQALGITYEGDQAEVKEVLGAYEPPASDHKVIKLINDADSDAKYHISQLDSEKKKKIALIKKHLTSPRIIAMISAIRSQLHRNVFETQFVLYLIDKGDVTPEDVSTIANLANENVRSLLITEEIAVLNDRLAEASADDEGSRKFTTSLADSLATKAAEYNSCQNRMQKLHSDLAGSRSERLKQMGIINESLAKYVELARTQEGRDYLIKLTKKRESKLYDEARRIESLGDLVAEIKGVSIEELMNFR